MIIIIIIIIIVASGTIDVKPISVRDARVGRDDFLLTV